MFNRTLIAAALGLAGMALAACGSSQQPAQQRSGAAAGADSSPQGSGTPLATPSAQPRATTESTGQATSTANPTAEADRPARSSQTNHATTARLKIREFQTPGGKGYFYTTNETEAGNAKTKHGFTPLGTDLGYVSPTKFTGSGTMYRLRYKPFPSYLVTLSPTERDKLVASGRFVYEGVLGHVFTSGGQKDLWRVTNNSRWRIVLKSRIGTLGTGWQSDGTLGSVWSTP